MTSYRQNWARLSSNIAQNHSLVALIVAWRFTMKLSDAQAFSLRSHIDGSLESLHMNHSIRWFQLWDQCAHLNKTVRDSAGRFRDGHRLNCFLQTLIILCGLSKTILVRYHYCHSEVLCNMSIKDRPQITSYNYNLKTNLLKTTKYLYMPTDLV